MCQEHHRLAQAISYTDSVLDAVTPQLLFQPTPCRAWNLRMLLEHAGESLAALYEGFTVSRVAVSPPEAESSGPGDAAAVVSDLRARAAALLDASAAADGGAQVTIGDEADAAGLPVHDGGAGDHRARLGHLAGVRPVPPNP